MNTLFSLSLGFALLLVGVVPAASAHEPSDPPSNTDIEYCSPFYLGLAPIPHACVYGPWGIVACVWVHHANNREVVDLCSVGPERADSSIGNTVCVPNSSNPAFCARASVSEGVCTIFYFDLDPQWNCWQPIPETDAQLPGRYCYENTKTKTEACVYRDLPGSPCWHIEQSGRTLSDTCAPDMATTTSASVDVAACTPPVTLQFKACVEPSTGCVSGWIGMVYYNRCASHVLDAAERCWNVKTPNIDGCLTFDSYGNPCIRGYINDHYAYGSCPRFFPIYWTEAGTTSTWYCHPVGDTGLEACYGDTRGGRICAGVYDETGAVESECTPLLNSIPESVPPAPEAERECWGGRVAGIPMPVACLTYGTSGVCAEAYPHHGPEPILRPTCIELP